MPKASNDVAVVGQPIFSSSSTQLHNLGEKCVTSDGRIYRYCKAGAVALVPGKLQQASAEVTADQNLAVAAAAIGDTTITTTTTVTVTANQFANGYAVIAIGPGPGYIYKIKSHPAATAAAVTLTLEDPIQVALTTSSRVDLVANPYNGVVVNPTTATSIPVGVAVYPIAIGEFGWIQTGGVAPILVDDQTVVVGTNISASNQAAGACEPHTGVQAIVGQAVTGGATTDYVAVKLLLDS